MKSLTVFPVAVAVLASLTVQASGTPVGERSSRSIWPFVGSPSSSEESAAAPEADVSYDAAIAQGILKVGPNDRRIWKIHKYQGIDIRPIDMVPEQDIAVPLAQPANLDPRNPAQTATSGSNVIDQVDQSPGNDFQSSVENSPAGHSVSQSGDYETTTEELDLSFLDDLGGMAWFLPEPKDEEAYPQEAKIQVESQAPPAEDDQPGFLSSLLSKLTFGMLGSSSRPVKGNLPELQAIEPAAGLVESHGSEPLYQEATYHLPETKGNYVAYRLPISEQADVVDPTGSSGSQVNSYSDDTQSTSFAGNAVTADLPAAPREPEVHGDQPVGYQSLNPRGYQYGAPIKAFVEGPTATVRNSAPLQTTGNGFEEDDANVLKPSDYASLSLSSVLPYREHADFGSHGPTSDRRVSEDLALKDQIEEVPEVEEEEAAEPKSPAVFVVEPTLEVATTYSKIRNHGPANSST